MLNNCLSFLLAIVPRKTFFEGMKHAHIAAKSMMAAAIIACCLPLQGCAVALIGAGIGAVSYATSQKKKAYGDYRTQTEQLNLEREKAGLKPNAVLTYDQWSKGDM
jgi:hypothetical protein